MAVSGDPGDNPMTDTDGDGIYEITMDIVQGTAHNYIFTIGTNGDWSGKEALNGHNCAVGTFDDRDVSIGSGPSQTVGPFCFAQCCRCDHAYSDAKYTKKPSTPNQGGDFETAVDTSSAVDVTFMVDMALEAVSAKGVFLAGSGTVFGAPGTNQAMKLKPFAGSIYQVTTKLTAGKKYHYTVTNGVGSASAPLETQEDLLNQECGDATFNAQRIIKVPDSPGGTFVSPQICFGGCKACKEYTKKVKVTFLVDMAGANSVEGSGVYLAGGGTFGVPGDNKMKVLRGKLHTITMTLPAYSHHAFAFVNGMTSDWSGKEDISGLPCAAGQYNDREFTAGDGDMTVGPFCYGKCCACGGAKTVKIKFLVNFINTEVAASGAFIAGGSLGLPGQLDKQLLDDGTGLDAVALDGIYTGMIEVSANAHQVYTITNGDCQDWLCKEDIVGKPCAFGAWADRYIGNTGDKDFTVEQCFGHCASCARADTGTSKVDLSFQVDMGKETVNADGVYLSGGVFGPSGSSKLFKMAKTSGSIYAVTLSGWLVNLKP